MRILAAGILIVAGAVIAGCDSSGAKLPESCAALATKLQSEGKSLPDLTNMTEINRSDQLLRCDVDGDGRINGNYIEAMLDSRKNDKGEFVCVLVTNVSHCSEGAITCGGIPISGPGSACSR